MIGHPNKKTNRNDKQKLLLYIDIYVYYLCGNVNWSWKSWIWFSVSPPIDLNTTTVRPETIKNGLRERSWTIKRETLYLIFDPFRMNPWILYLQAIVTDSFKKRNDYIAKHKIKMLLKNNWVKRTYWCFRSQR